MASVGYEQSSLGVYANGLEPFQFLKKGDWIQDDATTDDACDPFMKYTGRDDVQNMTSTAKVYGVSGIVSALISRDTVKSISEDVDDLSFSLVAPLKPDDSDILFHGSDCVDLRRRE
jgi:hypothetical protein